jgi:hypothetical protein
LRRREAPGGHYLEGFLSRVPHLEGKPGRGQPTGFLVVSAAGRMDCWITLGTHLEVQNLSVVFSVLWFPKNLIIHPLAIYCAVILVLVVSFSEVEKFSSLVITG